MSLKDAITRAAQIQREEGFSRLVRKSGTKALRPFLELADSYGLIGPEVVYSEDYYSKRQKDPWRREAHNISRIFIDEFSPNSVIDFGCSIGSYLEPFHEAGIDILGVEGNPAAFNYAVVPREFLVVHDLREPYITDRKFDLAFSIEVAEHIPEAFDDAYVDTIANASDTVVLSAAPPGQGGTHHVNEKPRSYWKGKFEDRGMKYDAKTVEVLRRKINVEFINYVPENIFVFVRE